MKFAIPVLVAMALGLAFVGAQGRVEAYTTCGQPQGLSSFPIPVYVHAGGIFTNVSYADLNRELDRALADWEALPDSNITFYRTTSTIDGWYPRFSVSSQPTVDPTYAANTACNMGAGYTQWMIVNSDYANFDTDSLDGVTPGKLSLEMVLRHEIGHWLGLGHSCATPDALMCVDWAVSVPLGVDRPIDADAQSAMALFYGSGPAPTPTATPAPTPAPPTLVSCERVATYSDGTVTRTPTTGC